MASETTTSAPTRTESDSMGTIEVASDRYWGAQTVTRNRVGRVRSG